MLQTIIVLAILFIMFILGGWMTFFGHRAFRFCGTLFGFALGVGGVLFGAWQLGYAFDSILVLIATPLAGLIFGLLGAFVPIVGAGLGGLSLGFFYGIGIVYCADVLLGGAIPSMLYTIISLLLVVVAFVLCIVFRDAARWLTTALSGSYIASLALTLALMWFLSGGFNATDAALSGSFILQIMALYGMISSTTKIFLLLFAVFFGVLGCVLQAHSANKEPEEESAMLDFSSAAEDTLLFDEEDPLFEEDSPRKSKRRKRKRDRDLEEDSDVLDIFAAEKEEAEDATMEDASGAKAHTASRRVNTVQQISTSSETDRTSRENTKVFRRVGKSKSTSSNKGPTAQPRSSTQKQSAPPQQNGAPSYSAEYNEDDAGLEPQQRLTPPSRFVPRSQRRKK